MEPRAARELGSYLASDEKLVWAGSPDPWRYATYGFGPTRAGLVAAGLAGICWALLVLLVIGPWLELGLGRGLLLALLVPVSAAAAGLLLPLVDRYREARHVAYGLTDRRAIVLIGGRHSRIEEFAPSRFLAPARTDHGDGTATVLFHPVARVGGKQSAPTAGFVAIRDADTLVREISGRIAEAPAGAKAADRQGGSAR